MPDPAAPIVNVAAHLPRVAAAQPYAPAIFAPDGHDRRGRTRYTHLTYRQLDEASDRIARGLHAVGIERGTRVALMVRPSLELFSLTFGLFKAGAVPVLIDPGIGLGNMKSCLARARPEAFIGIPAAQLARLVLRWGKESIRTVITVGPRGPWLSLDEVERRGRSTGDALAPTAPDDLAAILFTSGSTGAPKGAVYTHGNFAAQVDAIRRMYDIRPGEVDLPTFPLFALFDPALGMTTVIPDMDPTRPAQADPEKIARAIDDFGVTNMFGSPALLNTLSRWGETEGVRLRSLRRVISAGAPVPARVMARVRGMLSSDAVVVTPYGATECLPVASIESREVLGETAARTDEGAGVCVGRPVPEAEVSIISITDAPIVRWSDARVRARGEIGEITVRGPMATRALLRGRAPHGAGEDRGRRRRRVSPPHGRPRLPRRRRPPLVLRPQEPAGRARGPHALHRALRGRVQRAPRRLPERAGRRRARGPAPTGRLRRARAAGDAARSEGAERAARARQSPRPHARPRHLPGPPGLPGRHPPQREDPARGAGALGERAARAMKVLVTGGGGFLGGAVVERLIARGHEVRSFSRGRYPALDALGVEHARGDLGRRRRGARGGRGLRRGGPHGGQGGRVGRGRGLPARQRRRDRRTCSAACRAAGVSRLVYTSTPSVVHEGGDLEGGDESLPYTTHPSTAYQATKTEAEKAVLAAKSPSLSVVALRPHLVWGPGDPHLVPRIIARGRRGLIALPGGGRARIDTIYVDNAADAHLAALDRLEPGAACDGKAYFITNGDPRPTREIVLGILRAAGIDARVVPVSRRLAHAAGAAMETAFRLAAIEHEPPLTRFVAEQLSTSHHFRIDAARRDLGWTPAVSIDEGLERLAAWFESRR